MIEIKKDRLIIELNTSNPEETLLCIQKGIIEAIQILHKGEEIYNEPDLPIHIYYLLELQRALLPTSQQLKQMGKTEKE